MTRDAKLAEAATDLLEYVRKPIELQVLDAQILQAEGRVVELKALREDWGKLSPAAQAAVFQYLQRAQR